MKNCNTVMHLSTRCCDPFLSSRILTFVQCTFCTRCLTMGTATLTPISTLLHEISPASPGWLSVGMAYTTLLMDLPLAQRLLLATCLASPLVLQSCAMSFPMKLETLPCSSRQG